MSHAYAPGPGDLLPPFAGHPHDPQCPENNSVVKTVWILVFLLVAFGVVGRIDYESELAMADMRIADRKWAAEVAASQVAR